MQHLWRSPKAAADPGWWRRLSQLSMIIKNLPEKELLRCGEALVANLNPTLLTGQKPWGRPKHT
eukprot:scaffold14553_cov120-Isochrysis_galbana.AAC.5